MLKRLCSALAAAMLLVAAAGMCYLPAGMCEQHAADVLAHKRHSALRLLQIGQACQARGDHAMARSCFDEVMRLCPGSEYAQAAGVRMGEMRVAMQSQP